VNGFYQEASYGNLSIVGAAGDGYGYFTLPVDSAARGIFVYGNNLAVVQNQDYTLNSESNSAKARSHVTVYLTGIGPLDNPVGLGHATPSQPLSQAATAAQATVGGMPAQIAFIHRHDAGLGRACAG
jgi:uncharacterized protein (TIGR03437 family)